MSEEKINELYTKIVDLVQTENTIGLALGKFALEMKETKGYKAYADTWLGFLALPEITKKRTTIYRYEKIYRDLVLGKGIDESKLLGISPVKLGIITKVINSENVDEWLEKARTLTARDIRRLVEYGDIDPMECEHNFEAIPMKYKCTKCGEITKHNLNDT